MELKSEIEQIEKKPEVGFLYSRRDLHEGWKFRQSETGDWMQATVPGCNFSDLYKNGMIPDPFYRDNEDEVQWVENHDWEYYLDFEVTKPDLESDRINILFEGLDTYADVHLNNTEILTSDNMFVAKKASIKDVLQVGTNSLMICFHSPLKKGREKRNDEFLYPAGNDHSEENLSVYSRKAPYHFGWDWGPRFVSSGICRPVYLEFINSFKVEDIHLLYDIESSGTARVNALIGIDSEFEGEVKLALSCESDAMENICHKFKVGKGHNNVSVSFSIRNVRRWWPHDMGEPYLYKFKLEFESELKKVTKYKTQGFREVELVNEQDDMGQSFFLKVNGIPIFAKGANYIPQDSFLNEVGDDRYEKVFEDTVSANMNMLRVWGGGIYEKDIFYDLADKYGILVWQDFMFACTMYPGDDEFLASVEKEAIYNIQRLKDHPCLALWCGNNEINQGWNNWDWHEEFSYSKETSDLLETYYHKLFNELLPGLVAKYDPKRFYFPSSPISHYEDIEDFKNGDNHYWGVWHKLEPFADFKKNIPRFMSEYGFQSFPLMDSVMKYAEPSDFDIDSKVMKIHQKHPRGNQIIKEYLLRDYQLPKDFESFLYLSQVLQARGITIAIEAHRRAMPFCMGSLYWQLNDCWPVASWSGIDYYGNWKALHYAVKKAFSPILVSNDINDDTLSVFVVSDKLEDKNAILSVTAIDFEGNTLNNLEKEITIKSSSSTEMLSISLTEFVGENDHSGICIISRVKSKGEVLSENIGYLRSPKDLSLPKPDIKSNIVIRDDSLEVSLNSKNLVMNVYLSIENVDGNFSDNFFDLLPLVEKKVSIPYVKGANGSIPKLKILSLRDTH